MKACEAYKLHNFARLSLWTELTLRPVSAALVTRRVFTFQNLKLPPKFPIFGDYGQSCGTDQRIHFHVLERWPELNGSTNTRYKDNSLPYECRLNLVYSSLECFKTKEWTRDHRKNWLWRTFTFMFFKRDRNFEKYADVMGIKHYYTRCPQ